MAPRTLAANSVSIDIVLQEIREIQCDWIVRKRGEVDLSAAIGHVNGLVDCRLVAGAFDHIVCVDAAKLFDDSSRVLVVDDAIGAECSADR